MLKTLSTYKIPVLATALVLGLAALVPAAIACTQGDEARAINLAKREVGADRDTHIFVAVPVGDQCDDWIVYKRTPGTTGVTACIVTIEDWQVVAVQCCPTGC